MGDAHLQPLDDSQREAMATLGDGHLQPLDVAQREEKGRAPERGKGRPRREERWTGALRHSYQGLNDWPLAGGWMPASSGPEPLGP